MQSEATVDRDKEIKCLMYMALHLDVMTSDLLGSDNEISKAVSAVKFMFLREIGASDRGDLADQSAPVHH